MDVELDGKSRRISGIKALTEQLREDLLSKEIDGTTRAQLIFKFFEIFAGKDGTNSEPPAQETGRGEAGIMSYAEFCRKVGYYDPFQKQIEMFNFAFGEGSENTTSLLLASRGYGKTDLIVICGLAYMIYLDREYTSILVTAEEENGKSIVKEVAECLKLAGVGFDVCSSTKLRVAGLRGKDNSIELKSIGSSGFRGKHPRKIICDDIVIPNRVSPAERERVKRVYNELPKLTKNILIIGQPTHPEDLLQDLRAQSGPRKLILPYGSMPELDNRHDLEAQKAAGVSLASINASYYLKLDANTIMPFYGLEEVGFFPQLGSAGFLDPSDEGEDSTAFVVGAKYGDQLIAAGFEFPETWDFRLNEIISICNGYKTGKMAFETNKLGNLPVRLLRSKGANVVGWHTGATESNAGGGAGQGKHGRILNAATFRNYIKLCNYIPETIRTPQLMEANRLFNKRVKSYEAKSPHKDAADALANLLIYLGIIQR